MKKKLLFVSHLNGLSGAERSLFTIVTNLKNNHNYEIVVLIPFKGPLADKFNDIGIKTIIFPYFFWFGKKHDIRDRIFRIFANFCSLGILLFKVNKIRPHLIYTNSIASPVGAAISLILKIPHIWHIREFVFEDFNGYYDFGEKLSMSFVKKSSSLIIFNSNAVKNKFKDKILNKKKSSTIYNGFEFKQTQLIAPLQKYNSCIKTKREINIIIVGAISPGKGIEDAIRALAVLVSKGYLIRLSIVGHGDKTIVASLKTLAKQLSVSDNLTFSGFINGKNKINELYNNAAITLVCSRSEAFGRTAVESLAVGTPVIATRSGGVTEIVEDNTNGFLYNPGGYKELAAKIEILILNQKLYTEFCIAGKRIVQNKFSIEKYIDGITNAIDDIVETHHN